MKESTVTAKSLIRISKYFRNVKLFRNNVGLGWVGVMVAKTAAGIVLRNPRRTRFGLFVGSGDYIGWRSITITPDMVGQRFAQFVSVEFKRARGKEATKQTDWRNAVNDAGGFGVKIDKVEDVEVFNQEIQCRG